MSGSPRLGPQWEPRVSTAPLKAGLARSDLTIEQLWLGYLSVGGAKSMGHMVAELRGDDLPEREYDVIAQALNDHFVEHGINNSVTYGGEIGRSLES